MSTKNSTHSAEITNRQPNRRHATLLGISLILLAAFVITFITVQSRNSQAVKNANPQPVVYSDALAMQYAQPWLAKQQVAMLAAQYSNTLAMQYAQPWLDKSQVVAVPYSDALAMQYAQPWLDKQQAAPVTFTYNDFLELFYAQAWLDMGQSGGCNGRLDLMYACQYGNWQPQK